MKRMKKKEVEKDKFNGNIYDIGKVVNKQMLELWAIKLIEVEIGEKHESAGTIMYIKEILKRLDKYLSKSNDKQN